MCSAFQGTIDAIQKSINGTYAQYVATPAKFAIKVSRIVLSLLSIELTL